MILELTTTMINLIQLITVNQEIVLILVAALFLTLTVWNICLTLNLRQLKKRSKELFKGSNARDLEEIICRQIKDSRGISKEIKKLAGKNKTTYDLALKSVHKVGVVRFNPFDEVGGNQSFAIALLNDSGDGVTISSLFGREGTRVYAKGIKNKESEYKLSGEEKEAINKAMEIRN